LLAVVPEIHLSAYSPDASLRHAFAGHNGIFITLSVFPRGFAVRAAAHHGVNNLAVFRRESFTLQTIWYGVLDSV
jgi:hypothetical protein